jgi:ferritin-like metal-binding protein YciE
MKQSSTTARTRGRKLNKTAAAQHRTGGRQAASGENSNPRANAGSASGSSSTNSHSSRTNSHSSAGQNTANGVAREHSHSFKGQSHLEKFFLAQLKDIYYAEKKIIQSLPKMQEASTTEQLKDAFEDHLHQTERHVKRLEKVFQTLGQKAEGEKCEAIEGIAREVDNIIEETEEGTLTRDAALIIAAQKVEHYEIATYGGLVQLAITMQLHDAADLLDKTLVEEEDTDALLTEIAENEINLRAEHEGGQEGQKEEDENEEDEDKE